MTTTRTDVHAPVNLVTEDYDYFGSYDNGTASEKPDYLAFRQLRAAYLGIQASGVYGDSNQKCDHCGAFIRYGAILLHTPTSTYITVGETCLDNRFELATADFQALRKAAALNRERRSLAQRVEEFCQDNPVAVWATYAYNMQDGGLTYEVTDDFDGQTYTRGGMAEYIKAGKAFYILGDLGYKLGRYGSLSPAQVTLVGKLLDQISERYERQVRWDADKAAAKADAQDAPEGRVRVTGEVVSTKWVENDFGGTLKMLVKADEGYTVWMSVPSSLDLAKGDRFTAMVKLERAKDDSKHAFGSRPTKAEKL